MKWFIADIHADHEKVLIGPRGEAFPTLPEWQEHIFGEINRRASKPDTLYILGDFAFKDPVKWRQKIKCNDVWLIKGNHDPSALQCGLAFGKKVRDTYETKCLDAPCFLSHYAHAFWPKSHRGSIMCYGHCHGARESTMDEWMPDRRSMDVCPETIFRLIGRWGPISEVEIHDLLMKKKGHDHVEFYEDSRGKYNTKTKDGLSLRELGKQLSQHLVPQAFTDTEAGP